MVDVNVETKTRKNVQRTKRAIFDLDAKSWIEGRGMPAKPGGVKIDVIGDESVTVMLNDLPEHIVHASACFGLKTMLTNLGKGDGNEYTSEAIEEVVSRLTAGHWSDPESRGSGLVGAKAILDALVKVYAAQGKTIDRDALKAKLESLDEDAYKAQRKTWLAIPAVKLEVERAQEERRQARLAALAEAAEGAELPDL